MDLTDYTAFEVFAHDYDIPVGECEELSGYVNYALPANMTHQFVIRSYTKATEQDIVIDWGDGTINQLKDITPTISGSEYRYMMNHTYTTVGKHIIKIFGNKYFGFLNTGSYSNIMCRVFDYDLPVASHITNFSSFAQSAMHLLHVDVSHCAKFNAQYSNISNLFNGSKNLLSATGFASRNKQNISYASVFYYCYSLETTDLILAHSAASISEMCCGCSKLVYDIADLFYFFNIDANSTVNVNKMLKICSSLTGTVPANKLWNRRDVNWTNTTTAFEGCSNEIRSQVPVSWGGTASDNIIEKTDEEKMDELKSIIYSLNKRITELENA